MALKNCPECGKENVSDKAVSCPGCGYPMQQYEIQADTFADETADASAEILTGPFEEGAADSSEDTGVPGDLAALAIKLLAQETSPEVQKIKLDILRRIATESDIKPARIPAPMNITEIGGYFNLMMKLNQQEMLRQTLTSILGLPMQPPKE